MQIAERLCLECGKTVRGRVDKKFCDDFCRNAYNNRRNSDQTSYVRNINNTLRRNRRIMEELLPAEGLIKLPRTRLAELGFDFRYHTHQYTNRKGHTYHFSYEFGYLPLENDWLLLVKRMPG